MTENAEQAAAPNQDADLAPITAMMSSRLMVLANLLKRGAIIRYKRLAGVSSVEFGLVASLGRRPPMSVARLADAVGMHKARIVCTRKTTPGLRILEKEAVRLGGGANHRFGLDDAMLIKDNHVAIAGGVAPALRRAKAAAGHLVKIELEVDTLDQLAEALDEGVDAVLLDNMDPQTLRRAVAMVDGRAITEASGRITRETVPAIAAAGVDLISSGWITHSAPILDLGLDIA